MTKKERGNKKIFLIATLLVVSAIIFLLTVFLNNEKIVNETRIPISVEVSDVTGLKVEESLDFGRLVPGSSAGKKITINNSFEFPVTAYFETSGEIKNLILIQSPIQFNSAEGKEISVSAVIPQNQTSGNYTGEMIIRFVAA